MALNLDRIVVVELTEAIAGPTVGQVLADLGARVIKIENPNGGDGSRGQGDPKLFDSGSLFHMLNRGKRSVALDLADESQRALLAEFIERRADVVVQNLRPGVAERLGVGAEHLLERAPRLVHCSISGFPQATCSYHKAGYDLILQAFSGILQTTGEPDREPARIGVAAIDMTTGLWGALAILDALIRRETTGRGGIISTSLLESAVFMMSAQIGQYQFTGAIPRRWGTRLKEFVPLSVYPTQDGVIAIAAATNKLFRSLAVALGEPGMAADARFATMRDREANRDALDVLIVQRLKTGSTRQWLERFDAAGVPASPVNSVRELLASPELAQAQQLVQLEDMGDFKIVAAPFRVDGRRPVVDRRSERLGESTSWFQETARGNDGG